MLRKIKNYLVLFLILYQSSLFASTNEQDKIDANISPNITAQTAKLELSLQLSEKNPEQAIEISKKILISAKNENDIILEAVARHSIGISMRKLGLYNSAIDQITIASKIFAAKGIEKEVANTYNTLGLIRSSQGKYSTSLELHIKALSIRRKINDMQGIAISYNNLGNNYRNSVELEKSLEFFYKAIEIKKDLKMLGSLAYSYNNIGHTFRRMQDYDNARKYYNLALEIRTDINSKSGIASSLNHIGTILEIEGKFARALSNYEQSLEMRREIGDQVSEVGSLNNIGNVLSEMGKNNEALANLHSAMELSKSLEAPVIMIETLLFISNVYERMGQFEAALNYYKIYFDEHSKLFNETNSRQLIGIQTDLGVKENQLKVKYLQNLATAEKRSRDKENKLYLVSAVLFFFVFILLIHRYLFVKKMKNQYQNLYSDLETKSKQLTQANNTLLVLSRTDSLTALFNRRVFDEQLDKELLIAIRNKKPLSLLIIDIDNFKNLNDEFGHQVGDDILKKVAKILADVARRPEDTVCRYGGEEFVVILANTSVHGASGVAENIRSRVENESIPAATNSLYDFLSVSIGGYTVVPDIDISAKKIILAADNALYSAKVKGKNCVVFSEEKV